MEGAGCDCHNHLCPPTRVTINPIFRFVILLYERLLFLAKACCVMSDYFRNLQQTAIQLDCAKLAAVVAEFRPVLQQLPQLQQEVDALLVPDQLLDYADLVQSVRPKLEQANAFLFELAQLPAAVRHAPEMQALLQSAQSSMTLQSVALFAGQLQPLVASIRQQQARQQAKRATLFKWAGGAAGVVAVGVGVMLSVNKPPVNSTPPAATVAPPSVAAPVAADDLTRGIAAYRRGDYPLALQLLLPLATQNNGIAQYYLAVLYDEGEGVAKDTVVATDWFNKARPWLQTAAEQGNAQAQFNLGRMYYYGKGGLAQDAAMAVSWYRKAAE